jgi:hypothetical protein
MQRYLVIKVHVSEFPEPISFGEGALLKVGERYEGDEGWEDWFFCEVPGHPGGWVPRQLLAWVDKQTAVAKSSYTARELNVHPGEHVSSDREINGWRWCVREEDGTEGWVPVSNLQLESS